jgi:hypothetical protein
MMTQEIKFVDSAFPVGSLEGAQGQAFYAGGDTPHVWTREEVMALGARYLIPVYVRSNPGNANPLNDAAAFLLALHSVYRAPRGILVALDTETAADPSYVTGFVGVMNAGGYPVIDYGSQNDVFGNKNPDGYYWGAQWTGVPHIFPGDQATQYVNFPQYDLSEFDSTLPLWDTQAVPVQPHGEAGELVKQAFIPFPAGSRELVILYRDFLGGKAQSSVRVGVHSAAKGYTVTVHDLTDALPVLLKFPEPDTDAVSLVLLSGLGPVGFCLA